MEKKEREVKSITMRKRRERNKNEFAVGKWTQKAFPKAIISHQ